MQDVGFDKSSESLIAVQPVDSADENTPQWQEL